MSFQALFGAYPRPAAAASLLAADGDASLFHGSSRGGRFAQAMALLVAQADGDPILRALSGESWTWLDASSGRAAFTRIGPDDAAAWLAAIGALVAWARGHAATLASVWSECLGGPEADEVLAAIDVRTSDPRLNAGTPHGDDGDTAAFVFATLHALADAITRTSARGDALVWFDWRPG